MCLSLHFGDSINDDDVDNRMEAYLEDESKTFIFYDGMGTSWGRGSCGSLKEGVHEGGINE
jgi:hypothetical protein